MSKYDVYVNGMDVGDLIVEANPICLLLPAVALSLTMFIVIATVKIMKRILWWMY